MLSKWPIRVKLFVGLGLLVLVVAILSSSGLYATYAYRNLVKSLSWRVVELPLAAELSQRVGDLRSTLSELHGLRRLRELHTTSFPGTQRDVVAEHEKERRRQQQGRQILLFHSQHLACQIVPS